MIYEIHLRHPQNEGIKILLEKCKPKNKKNVWQETFEQLRTMNISDIEQISDENWNEICRLKKNMQDYYNFNLKPIDDFSTIVYYNVHESYEKNFVQYVQEEIEYDFFRISEKSASEIQNVVEYKLQDKCSLCNFSDTLLHKCNNCNQCNICPNCFIGEYCVDCYFDAFELDDDK